MTTAKTLRHLLKLQDGVNPPRNSFALEMMDGTVYFSATACAHFDLLGQLETAGISGDDVVNGGFVTPDGKYTRGGDLSEGILFGENATVYYGVKTSQLI